MKLWFTDRQEMPKLVFPNLTNTLKSQITEILSPVYVKLYDLYVLYKLFVNTGEAALLLFFPCLLCTSYPFVPWPQHQQDKEHNFYNAYTFLRPRNPVVINTNTGQ